MSGLTTHAYVDCTRQPWLLFMLQNSKAPPSESKAIVCGRGRNPEANLDAPRHDFELSVLPKHFEGDEDSLPLEEWDSFRFRPSVRPFATGSTTGAGRFGYISM